jgi:RNase P subunit RPR2
MKIKTATLFCERCQARTPHAEDIVADRESATVWHCLYCGEEQRPDGGNAKVLA